MQSVRRVFLVSVVLSLTALGGAAAAEAGEFRLDGR